MKTLQAVTAVALFAVSGLAAADPISYTYVDAAFTHDTMAGLDGSHGYELSGSYGIGEHFFVNADFARNNFGKYNYFIGDLVQERSVIWGGWHAPLNNTVDWFARLGYVHDDALFNSIGGLTTSDIGHGGHDLGVGVRSALTPKLELETSLDHDNAGVIFNTTPLLFGGDFNLDGTENLLTADLRWHVTPAFDLGLGAQLSSFNSQHRALLFARWNF